MTAEIDPSLPGGAIPSPGAALSPGASFSGTRGGSTVIPQPVPDRPLTFMDILDGAFSVVRARPRTVALILAVFVLPAHLVASWAQRNLFAAIDFTQFDTETGQFENQAEFESLTSPAAAFGPAALLAYVMLPFVGVAMTHLVAGWHDGVDRSGWDCVRFTLRKTPTILISFVAGKVFQIFTLGLGTPFTMLIAPVIAAEGLGPFAAVRRSITLSWRRAGPMILLTLAIAVVSYLLANALNLIPTMVAFLLGDWGWVGFFALGIVSQFVITSFTVGTAVLAYFDVRNRVEGIDLKRRIDRLPSAPIA